MVYPKSRHGISDGRLNAHLRQLMFDFVMRASSAETPADGRRTSTPDARRSRSAAKTRSARSSALHEPSSMRSEGMDAWIDTYHAIRRLSRHRVPAFLTDSAVGTQEENNLRHLIANLGRELPRDLVTPFLTSKHSLDFCLSYAEQAWQQGFSSLVVLGGDTTVGRPRCVEHAWDLRLEIREHEPELSLGRLGQPACRRRAAGRFPARRALLRRVLPDAGRQPSEPRSGEAIPRRESIADVPLPWECSASSITEARVRRRWRLSARFMPVPIGTDRGVRREAERGGCLRANDSGPACRSACVTSASAICRCRITLRGSSPRYASASNVASLSWQLALLGSSSAIDANRFASDEVAVDQCEHDFRNLGFTAPVAERCGPLDGVRTLRLMYPRARRSGRARWRSRESDRMPAREPWPSVSATTPAFAT